MAFQLVLTRSTTAGILAMPAVIFLVLGFSRAGAEVSLSDLLATATLERVAIADWNEYRAAQYEAIEYPAERLRSIREDTAFDAWLAQRAVREGIALDPQGQAMIADYRNRREIAEATDRLAASIHPSPADVHRMAEQKKWNEPLPETWEVLYIFLDHTRARTPEERQAVEARAGAVREQLTPENFSAMARLWSDAPSSTEGGYLGSITLDGLGPTFKSHLLQAPPGTIGGPYPTASGWNILYVRSHREPRERETAHEDHQSLTAVVLANERLEEIRRSPDGWNRLRDALGLTTDTLLRAEATAYQNFLLARILLAERMKPISPTEEELRAVFTEVGDRFRHPPRRRAREIFLTAPDWPFDATREAWEKRRIVRDRARELRQRILDGEDFAALAREVSTSDSATSGGDLGWVQQPSAYWLDSTLEALAPGEISPPVQTRKGFHLLQLLEVELHRPMTFEEARQECLRVWTGRQSKAQREALQAEFGGGSPKAALAPVQNLPPISF